MKFSFKQFARPAAVAACLALALCSALPVRAAVPHADRLPAEASGVLGIADAGAFWKKVHALPAAQAVERYLKGPELQQNLDYQQFQLDLSKIEAKLGFPLTFDQLLGPIFGDATLYIRAQGIGVPAYGVMLSVNDTDKAQKLLSQIDLMVKGAADKSATTSGTAEAAGTTTTFDQKTVAGVQFSHFVARGATSSVPFEGYYALAGKVLVFASTPTECAQCLGKGMAAAPNPALKPLISHLDWDKADMEGWIDGDSISKSLGAAGSLLGSSMGKASPESKVAFTTMIDPTAAMTKYALTPAPSKTTPNATPGKLDGLDFIGATPLYASISRSYDAQSTYDELATFANDPTIGAMTGQLGGPSILKKAEQTLGISFKDDVVPALANESFFSIDRIDYNSLFAAMSQVNAVAGTKLRDPAKMKATMQKIEAAIASKGMAAPAAPGATPAAPVSTFSSTQHDGVEVRGMSILPSISPTYAIAGDYLLIGLNQQSVFGALDAKAGPAGSASKSEGYQSMAKLAGDQPLYDFAMLDFARIYETVLTPFLAQFSGANGMQSPIPAGALDVARTLGSVAAISVEQDGLLVGYMNLKMR